jgi:UDP-N-acetylglucosamine 2-epimerase (non-hydrolysing)
LTRFDIVAGARPNFMKIAPIIRAIEARQRDGAEIQYRLVHTGQHYDSQMSAAFFDQLGIPEPHVNFEVGSGTQAEQTSALMVAYEGLLQSEITDLCIVVGDVNSTMACSIVARKAGVAVAHVEAGIRSGDWSMPEEINRILTDAIANYFFTTSETANRNLRAAGVNEDRIHFVGNTMIDTLLANVERLRHPSFWTELGLRPKEYLVLTLHRPSNVDDIERLQQILITISEGAGACPVVFPVHPRTAKTLARFTSAPSNIKSVEPQAYLEFNYLVKHAKAVITDSGGITEEATVLGVPCMTLRNTTERPETVTVGTNELLGSDPAALRPALKKLYAGEWKSGGIPDLWDGRAGERIVTVLARLFDVQYKLAVI